MLKYTTDIMYLKGVGPSRASALKDNGIETIEDLIYYFPRKYLDRTNVKQINSLDIGEQVAVIGTVINMNLMPIRRGKIFQLTLSDETGIIKCLWFNSISWISEKFEIGNRVAIFGKIEFSKGMQITHPEFDILDNDSDVMNTGVILPIYSSSNNMKKVGIDTRGVRRLVNNAIKELNIDEFLPIKIKKNHGLLNLAESLSQIHGPEDPDSLQHALTRLKFDELFFIHLLMSLRKKFLSSKPGISIPSSGELLNEVFDSLEFVLTDSQKNVLREIRTDFSLQKPMNRLIQGDVGSGKTIVSILAASMIIGNGYQVALMAPTELLAEQHYKEYVSFFNQFDTNVNLLTGKTNSKDKKQIYMDLSSGSIDVIIGTHALFQDDVEFKSLGLVIIDEQHKFGVNQRKRLISKGKYPEVLAMTATPIPRTLAFTIHGDMDISIISDLPKGRVPIKTNIVNRKKMSQVYDFIKSEVIKGNQFFIVYPIIEESDTLDLKAAKSEFNRLNNNELSNLNLGYLDGRMDKDMVEEIMNGLINKNLDGIIATTVIEVGINIPDATVMVIENAERFGLTQLHQLRGRIGRGNKQSYCFLVTDNDSATKRLEVIEKSNDGFAISDADLELRGPGEYFGKKQHGYIRTALADFVKDKELNIIASDAAKKIIDDDPKLINDENSLLREKFLFRYNHMLEFIDID